MGRIEEQKGKESDTDHGSDSWLSDIGVDKFIENYSAVQRRNHWCDINPCYRMRCNGVNMIGIWKKCAGRTGGGCRL